MGNTGSAYDEDDLVHQPRSYAGGLTDYGHQPPSYAGSSTDYGHRPRPYSGSSMDPGHQPRSYTGSSISHGPPVPSYAGSSTEHNYQHPMHPKRIADIFSSLDQVICALREAGLESSNLILGIDFTKSNEWTGRHSFNRKSLHAIGITPNPYEQAISIIGRTLSPFDEDNLIPCFGFGDATTHDKYVFSFYPNQQYCHGFEEALARYREIVPLLKLSGPTSFAPIIDAAINIVEASNRQYHVLVIIADGQVTRNPDTPTGSFSPQEQETINSIVAASHHPLSIILVGVGDGPWDSMKQFDDSIPHRSFDNFQFVNFTKIMSENTDISKKETAFALAALMEIPLQYKATLSLPPVNEDFVTDPRTRSLPPPREVIDHDNAVMFVPPMPNSDTVGPTAPAEPVCPICLTNPKDMAFGCGHTTCKDCGATLSTCPMCRQQITSRLRLYT
ncbi:E3 ubiquitin-protein ligase RGLG3 [Pistacia vera]|uniref:E3 ubiquitin-protein ligase RGLG3 n=1 Tax=Pistacia vera TaxID=55513 RepID=UPI001263D421|nr:E3 ubiquitin-protein ligase RGLG3 [Pistacia vera]XP_031279051.1 E3 ubiquitin-protein ligase RGLG3 [Pistacia vera]